MLSTITLLTSLLFAAIYPLCFFISADDPLKEKFHRFHIGLPNIVAGILTVFVCLGDYPRDIQITTFIWAVLFTVVTAIAWSRDTVNLIAVAAITILGTHVFGNLYYELAAQSYIQVWVWLLSGGIFCASLYAMNLGHWYLNVHGLPIKHLRRANYVLWASVIVRLIWDIIIIFTTSVSWDGEEVSAFQFLNSTEGFFIYIGLFFGVLFPAAGLYFSNETIRLKNTQSTTGILYVLLCGILIGDITFKYYCLRYGLAL